MNNLKILIISTAKTGNVWLRALLAHLYDLPIVEGDQADFEFNAQRFDQYGDHWITHKHYPFSEEILHYAQQNNIILLTTFRHPADILVSYFHFVRWITHTYDDEIALLRKDGGHIGENTKYFVESEMFIHHLVISYHWKPHCLDCIFYEDLLENPIQVLTHLSNKILPVKSEQIQRAVIASQMKYLKIDRDGNHFRKGNSQQWQTEVPPEIIELFKTIESYQILCLEMGYWFKIHHKNPKIRSNAPIKKFDYFSLDPFYQQTQFDNGVKITIEIIRCYLSVPNALTRWQSPTQTNLENSFFHWLSQPCETCQMPDSPLIITNYANYFYKIREDVRQAFPHLQQTSDCLEFALWFVTHAPLEYEIDTTFLDPISRMLESFVKKDDM
jgi:hypothetical protein